MKHTSYKLWASLFSFLFSFACVTISTFAWFMVGNDAKVDNLEFGVHGEDNIMIGIKIKDEKNAEKYGVPVGGIYYGENGTLEDAILTDLGYLGNKRFHPLSSAYESEWLGREDIDKPILREIPSLYDIDGNLEASSGFYQFEFYFKSTENMYMYLDASTTVLPDEEKNAYVATTPGDIEKLNRVKDALRISFYQDEMYRIYEPNVLQPSNTRLFGRLDQIDTDGFYDYDLDTHKEYLFGECANKALAVYGEANYDPIVDDVRHINCFDAQTFSGVQPLDIEGSIANGIGGTVQNTETLAQIARKDRDNQNALTYLPRGIDTRLVVTVWAEGWDIDCTKDLVNASFLINLVFSGNY